jgi:hypothetical protein
MPWSLSDDGRLDAVNGWYVKDGKKVRVTTKGKICSIDDCDKPVLARELCSRHWWAWKRHGDPLAKPLRVKKPCKTPGCTRVSRAKGLCDSHYQKQLRENNEYVQVYLPNHPNASKRGYVAEHTRVMSEILGRPLLPGESVHHKNGRRFDNHPENLELWVTHQPKGQRPEDLVAWAHEIIQRYGEN